MHTCTFSIECMLMCYNYCNHVYTFIPVMLITLLLRSKMGQHRFIWGKIKVSSKTQVAIIRTKIFNDKIEKIIKIISDRHDKKNYW